MNHWRYNPDDYAIGDTIWLRFPQGWHAYNARSYEVVKKTPSGQIVARKGDAEIRLTRRGDLVGSGAYSSNSACSAETARKLRAEARDRLRWHNVAKAAEAVQAAARKQDDEGYHAAMADLQKAYAGETA